MFKGIIGLYLNYMSFVYIEIAQLIPRIPRGIHFCNMITTMVVEELEELAEITYYIDHNVCK